jgi:branched-chain amino acid transport system ATP-binding protein
VTLLELSSVTKRFGGLTALDCVDLSVAAGSVHALVGPNGAGKTTLINLLTRLYDPTEGRIAIDGQDMAQFRPHQVVDRGIARIFQHIELFNNLTVLENVLVGGHSKGRATLFQSALTMKAARADRDRQIEAAMTELAFVGLADQAGRVAGTLTGGNGRLLGLARALASAPRLLLLDELVAGLNSHERRNAAQLVRRLRSERGVTVLAIEHDMKFISSIADRVTVLNFGRKIAEGKPGDVLAEAAVIKAYLGGGRYGHS